MLLANCPATRLPPPVASLYSTIPSSITTGHLPPLTSRYTPLRLEAAGFAMREPLQPGQHAHDEHVPVGVHGGHVLPVEVLDVRVEGRAVRARVGVHVALADEQVQPWELLVPAPRCVVGRVALED